MGTIELDRLVAVITILAVFLYIGWTYRTNDTNAFHTADRQVGPVRSIATLFTVVGAPHFAIFTSIAYILGGAGLGFYLGTAVGFTVLWFAVPAIRRYIADDAHSFNDIAAKELGLASSAALTSLGLLYTLGVVVAQLILGGGLLAAFSGLPYWLCVVLMVTTVLGYLSWGGYRALVNTDVVQALVMLVFTAVLMVYVISQTQVTGALAFRVNMAGVIATMPLTPLLFLAGVLAITGSPEMWQRILTAQSDRTAQGAVAGAAGTMLLWGLMVVVCGVSISRLIPDAVPELAFVTYVTEHLPLGVLGLVSVLMIAAIVSTADTEIFMATVLIRKEHQRMQQQLRELTVGPSRLTIAALCVVSGIGAIMLTDLMTWWGVLLNLVYISAPLALAVLLRRGGADEKWRRRTFLVCFNIAVIAFLCVAFLVRDFFSWWALAIIVPASVPLAVPGIGPRQAAGAAGIDGGSLSHDKGGGT